MTNIGVEHYWLGQFDLARTAMRHADSLGELGLRVAPMLVSCDFVLADTAGAFSSAGAIRLAHPGTWDGENPRVSILQAVGSYDSALSEVAALSRRYPSSDAIGALSSYVYFEVALLRGRSASAHRARVEASLAAQRAGMIDSLDRLDAELEFAWYIAMVDSRPHDAIRSLDELPRRYNLARVAPGNRRYLLRAEGYAAAGQPARAHELMAEWAAAVPPDLRDDPRLVDLTRGYIAMADHRADSAIVFFRRARDPGRPASALPELAWAFDAAGMPDSAIALAERYLATPDLFERTNLDPFWLSQLCRRLAELYDARGDTQKALSYYGKFIALWKDAEPELQPQVQAAKRRMQQLSARKS